MKANVYDFDKTVYDGDASIDFFKYSMMKYPRLRIYIPIILIYFGLYFLNIVETERFKEIFFIFTKKMENLDEDLDIFWRKKRTKIKTFYLENQTPEDILISASPEFLLKPIADELGFSHLIATKYDLAQQRIIGRNCYGKEKPKRLYAWKSDILINEFYSDSLSDEPLAELAIKAFYVDGEQISSWPENPRDSISKSLMSLDFLRFIFCGGMGTLTNFLVSSTLSFFFDPVLSYVSGYVVSIFVTYSLNAYIIFNEKLNFNYFIKFVISYTPNFLILLSFVAVFINVLNWHPILVYGIAGLIGLPLTFILVKLYTFARKDED